MAGIQPTGGGTKLFILELRSLYDAEVLDDVLKELLNINDELNEFSLLCDIFDMDVFIRLEFCEAVEYMEEELLKLLVELPPAAYVFGQDIDDLDDCW